ncbi:contact-dependent growth inhibition system immunity protein [Flavobacterium sp.]|uniref:contact-dependent growth inhibition system immunity protein n=1 Tax=Flavobacterium sp. TaxID=239 RepID=UPI0012134AA3|nr:contact-dependent growth inhibition system immunity protein [Flavobacterium sp.]RZJ72382.1 MAG: hypothetical protein EOO49_05575 [Flavobacterium sp.]
MHRKQVNWPDKSLESLENDVWKSGGEEPTTLIRTCFALREKPLSQFEVEDLRIMIGQNIGLAYLIPMAIEVLHQNILAEGDFYEGDLLNSVLTADAKYWLENKSEWQSVVDLFESNSERLKTEDTSKSIKKQWFGHFSNFAVIG